SFDYVDSGDSTGIAYVDSVIATLDATNTILNGSGPPNSSLGTDGDFYIDVDANAIYGAKSGANWGVATSLVGLDGLPGSPGENGAGFTGGSYNSSTGQVTFTSNDGLGFATGDLRGEDGGTGPAGAGFTGGSYNSSTGQVTFTSNDGLGFVTEDLRGEQGPAGDPATADGNGIISTLPNGLVFVEAQGNRMILNNLGQLFMGGSTSGYTHIFGWDDGAGAITLQQNPDANNQDISGLKIQDGVVDLIAENGYSFGQNGDRYDLPTGNPNEDSFWQFQPNGQGKYVSVASIAPASTIDTVACTSSTQALSGSSGSPTTVLTVNLPAGEYILTYSLHNSGNTCNYRFSHPSANSSSLIYSPTRRDRYSIGQYVVIPTDGDTVGTGYLNLSADGDLTLEMYGGTNSLPGTHIRITQVN
ncbi:MAG: hypothetical protein AAFP08_14260, partial [Bacteroidota bacterium]